MDPDPIKMFMSNVSKDGLIVSVDPSDLKNVWKMGEEMQGQRDSNEHFAIDPRMFATVCSPGANRMALWYRASILGLIAQQTGLLAPELSNDAKDIVFNVAAKFPMKRLEPGVVYEGLPLDVQAFGKQIEEELRQRGLTVDPGT